MPEIMPRHFEESVRNARRSVSDRDLAQYSSFAATMQQARAALSGSGGGSLNTKYFPLPSGKSRPRSGRRCGRGNGRRGGPVQLNVRLQIKRREKVCCCNVPSVYICNQSPILFSVVLAFLMYTCSSPLLLLLFTPLVLGAQAPPPSRGCVVVVESIIVKVKYACNE